MDQRNPKLKTGEETNRVNSKPKTGDETIRANLRPHAGHRKRLKSRFLEQGLEGFEPHQALELLLFYGIPQKDTNEIAHRLLDTCGSFQKVMEASREQLLSVNGVGENVATLLQLIPALARYYAQHQDVVQVRFEHPDDVGRFLQGCYTGYTHEVISILTMNDLSEIVSFDILSNGDLGQAQLSMRNLVTLVMKHNATSVILCHNHPSGFALPSPADLKTTLQVKNALQSIGVKLIDHFVLGADDFISMAMSKRYKQYFR